ncbi:CLUMA_CG017661, isoform A [Clunio marinus]|uniref:CLUMA_CG017661, isoform A n=1 Tax=Clunio marinus TaxID=568069 RepID=A0A1J1J162_9DIPT|nr:CLUMA_CG017661, isoform A [Clunio marinus]
MCPRKSHLILLLCFAITEAFKGISINKGSEANLISAIKFIAEKQFQRDWPTVNILFSSNQRMKNILNDLVNDVLTSNEEKRSIQLSDCGNITKQAESLRTQNIILLSEISSFRTFESNLLPSLFDFKGFFLISLIESSSSDLEEIFTAMFKKNIYNVDVVIDNCGKISLYTFMPFNSNKSCGNTQPVNLQNCSIKVITFEDSFSIFKVNESDGRFDLKGSDIDILYGLSRSMNFHPNITFLDTFEPWGMVAKNGTVTGALGELVNKNAEIGIGNYFLKANRIEILDHSISYNSLPLMFIIPPGEELSGFKKLLQPYSIEVWILLSIILVTALCGYEVLFMDIK